MGRAIGSPFWTTGLKWRPSYPKQQEVYNVLNNYLPQMTGWLTGLPGISFTAGWHIWEADTQVGAMCWKDRLRLANNRMKDVCRNR